MSDTVNVIGVKADGSSGLLGTAPMPPAMKRTELAREYFGGFVDGDCSDADLLHAALCLYHDWLVEQGWQAPPLVVTPAV